MGNLDMIYQIEKLGTTLKHTIKTKNEEIKKLLEKNIENTIEIKDNIYIIERMYHIDVKNDENYIIIPYSNTLLIELLFYSKELLINFETKNRDYVLESNMEKNKYSEIQEERNNFVLIMYRKDYFINYTFNKMMIYTRSEEIYQKEIELCLMEYSKVYGFLKYKKKIKIFFVPNLELDGVSWKRLILIRENSSLQIIFHEIAHQWFDVSYIEKTPFWLMEAMSDFSSNYVMNKVYKIDMWYLLKKQRANYAAWLINNLDINLKEEKREFSTFEKEAVCHGKSSFFLYNLYRELGKSFFELIKEWLTGKDFWERCRFFLGKDYNEFIKQWVLEKNRFENVSMTIVGDKCYITGMEKCYFLPSVYAIRNETLECCKIKLKKKYVNIIDLNEYSVSWDGIITISFNEDFYVDGYIMLSNYLLKQKKHLSKRIIKMGLIRYPYNKHLMDTYKGYNYEV